MIQLSLGGKEQNGCRSGSASGLCLERKLQAGAGRPDHHGGGGGRRAVRLPAGAKPCGACARAGMVRHLYGAGIAGDRGRQGCALHRGARHSGRKLSGLGAGLARRQSGAGGSAVPCASGTVSVYGAATSRRSRAAAALPQSAAHYVGVDLCVLDALSFDLLPRRHRGRRRP